MSASTLAPLAPEDGVSPDLRIWNGLERRKWTVLALVPTLLMTGMNSTVTDLAAPVRRHRIVVGPLPIPVGHRLDPAGSGGGDVDHQLVTRPLRAEADLPRRPGPLHPGKPGGGLVAELRAAGVVPVRPELGQRDGGHHRPGGPLAGVPREPRRRDGRLRAGPLFRQDRLPERERLPDQCPVLAVDLPGQRPGGGLRGPGDLPAPPARPAPARGESRAARLPRPGPADHLDRLPDPGPLPLPEVGLGDGRCDLARCRPGSPGPDGVPGPRVHDGDIRS